jgi:hypothetical protein
VLGIALELGLALLLVLGGGNLKMRYGTMRQLSRKAHFIVPAQTHWTHVQRLSPENQEVSYNNYIPLQAGYRSKKQSSTHIWLHVTLLAVLFPQSYVIFFVLIFKVLSLCFAFPSPCLIIRMQPVCFSSGPPSCYIIPLFDAQTYLGSKSIILI